MDQKKHPYAAPRTTLSRVEVESTICSGSVQFGGNDKQVDIQDQQVNNEIQDFSGEEWNMGTGGNQ